jgi:hypothetical protein
MNCYFNPAHGESTRELPFAPDGRALKLVPVCRACGDDLDEGRVPAGWQAPPAAPRARRGWAKLADGLPDAMSGFAD